MNSRKSLKGAALITHNLKVYGNGRMQDGLKRLVQESKNEGFQQGIKYAMQSMSLRERLFGRYINN